MHADYAVGLACRADSFWVDVTDTGRRNPAVTAQAGARRSVRHSRSQAGR
jgi:hypothetical protein